MRAVQDTLVYLIVFALTCHTEGHAATASLLSVSESVESTGSNLFLTSHSHVLQFIPHGHCLQICDLWVDTQFRFDVSIRLACSVAWGIEPRGSLL
jgi:6-phosphogluconolactonase (cycloisomerase 2 family)